MRRKFFIWLVLFLAKKIKWAMEKRFNENFTPKEGDAVSISIFEFNGGLEVYTLNKVTGEGFFKVRSDDKTNKK